MNSKSEKGRFSPSKIILFKISISNCPNDRINKQNRLNKTLIFFIDSYGNIYMKEVLNKL